MNRGRKHTSRNSKQQFWKLSGTASVLALSIGSRVPLPQGAALKMNSLALVFLEALALTLGLQGCRRSRSSRIR